MPSTCIVCNAEAVLSRMALQIIADGGHSEDPICVLEALSLLQSMLYCRHAVVKVISMPAGSVITHLGASEALHLEPLFVTLSSIT